MFKRKYTIESRHYPEGTFIERVVDRFGKKYVRVRLHEGLEVDIPHYHIVHVTYGGWFMRWIYRKAGMELPNLKDDFIALMEHTSDTVKKGRTARRMMKIMRSRKREKKLVNS